MKSCIKNVFEQKIIKMKKSEATVNPGCQNVTLLEDAKINRSFRKITFFTIVYRKSADSALNSSVASGPYSPHVKDCTGLVT